MGKAPPKCSLCKAHGVDNLLKLHKNYCPYQTCGCKICKDVDRKRSQRALQTRIRRKRQDHETLMKQGGLVASQLDIRAITTLGTTEHTISKQGEKVEEHTDYSEFEDTQSHHDNSRKYDGGACLPSGSPPAGPTVVSTSTAAYPPLLPQQQMICNVSPPPQSSASSTANSPPPDFRPVDFRPPDSFHQAPDSFCPAEHHAAPTSAPPPRSSPSPSPGLADDVPALLWYLFSRLCWVSFAQVASSEHHHVSRVLTNALNELMLMVHQYPANNNSNSYQRSPPPPLPASHHQHMYHPNSTVALQASHLSPPPPDNLYSSSSNPPPLPPPPPPPPHRHHHHHHHHLPYRSWAATPTPPPSSTSPDYIPVPPADSTSTAPASSSRPQLPARPAYSPPPSAALLYSSHHHHQQQQQQQQLQQQQQQQRQRDSASLSPTPLSQGGPHRSAVGAYLEETHISQYIHHAHTVQRREEHRRLYPSDHGDSLPPSVTYPQPSEQAR